MVCYALGYSETQIASDILEEAGKFAVAHSHTLESNDPSNQDYRY